MTDPNRKLLCRAGWAFTRDSIYLTAEGLEVDSTEHHEISRRRVFFDDVHMVTVHNDRGWLYLLFTGIWGGFFTALGIFMIVIAPRAWPASIVFFVFGAPFWAFVGRLIFGRTVITVFGRRSKAILPFSGLRHYRAREVYGQICAAVRKAQTTERTAAVPAAE